MQWARSPTIGFNAAGELFENHPNTGSNFADDIACVNDPDSVWNNVIYSITSSLNETRQNPPTIEPRELYYDSYYVSMYMNFVHFHSSRIVSAIFVVST